MGKNKALVKVHQEGKYVVDINKNVDITKLTPTVRVALKSDSYELHKILPNKVDPLVSLMKVEKVRLHVDLAYPSFRFCPLTTLYSNLGPRFYLRYVGWFGKADKGS